jgi:VanZ family protein
MQRGFRSPKTCGVREPARQIQSAPDSLAHKRLDHFTIAFARGKVVPHFQDARDRWTPKRYRGQTCGDRGHARRSFCRRLRLSRCGQVGYDVRMPQRFIAIAAWACIAGLSYATLAHVEFVYSVYFKLAPFLMHVDMRTYAHFEHIIAFAIFGAIFAFAYPERVIFVCFVVFLSAVILEYLQTLTPDRHGTLIDAFEKIVGGALGIFAARAAYWCARIRTKFQN